MCCFTSPDSFSNCNTALLPAWQLLPALIGSGASYAIMLYYWPHRNRYDDREYFIASLVYVAFLLICMVGAGLFMFVIIIAAGPQSEVTIVIADIFGYISGMYVCPVWRMVRERGGGGEGFLLLCG